MKSQIVSLVQKALSPPAFLWSGAGDKLHRPLSPALSSGGGEQTVGRVMWLVVCGRWSLESPPDIKDTLLPGLWRGKNMYNLR